jgi:glycosyltransferase involved in cell wall biosynthesis
MCTYEGESVITAQLESISAQTRLPDELIVCDDASSDRTRALVDEFAGRAPFPVRLTRNSERVGPAANFERAIGRTSGEVIALCDQDDVWHSTKLQEIETAFAQPRRPGLVFSDARLIDDDARPLDSTYWARARLSDSDLDALRGDSAFEALVRRHVRFGGTVMGASMAFAAVHRDLVLPFPDLVRGSAGGMIHDAWVALMVAAVAPVAPLDEALLDYREHSRQQVGLRVQAPSVAREVRTSFSTSGRESVAERLDQLQTVHDRLAERCPGADGDRGRLVLDGWLTHLRARAALPPQHLRRVGPVLRELASGRYARHSSGVRSAARDLFR